MSQLAARPGGRNRDRTRPALVCFTSTRSGRCRRVDGFLAQVLQRRHNHGTFDIVRVDGDERPDLLERFGVERLPSFLVVQEKRVRARLVDPRGCRDIEDFLAPWLRRSPNSTGSLRRTFADRAAGHAVDS